MSLTKVSYSMIDGASVNVQDFGADPTGVADSTSAINAAFAKATALGVAYSNSASHIFVSKPVVFFPEGKYRITAPVGNVTNSVIVRGANAVLYSANTSISLLYLGTYNVTVENMTFDGGQYHIKFGGSRTEGGNILVNNCIFEIASKCCIITDRGDIPGWSGYPAIMRINNCRSYGSPFLETYTNGTNVTDCWLAWDVGTATQPLFRGNDTIVVKGLLEVPYGTPGASTWGRFSSPVPGAGFGSEDILSVVAYGCRFGGEATGVPLVVFSEKGCNLDVDGCNIDGVGNTYWGIFYQMPRRISIKNCKGQAEGFESTWGMWFYNGYITGNASIPSSCEIILDLGTKFDTAYQRVISPSVTQGGYGFAFIPDQNMSNAKETTDLVLENFVPGDGITWWGGAPYTYAGNGAAYNGTASMLGYTLGKISSTQSAWSFAISVAGFNPGVEGVYTVSCWVKSDQQCVARVIQDSQPTTALTVVTNTQTIQPGYNLVTGRIYYNGSTALAPSLAFSGSYNGSNLVVGLIAIHYGGTAARWQPPGYSYSALPRQYYGSATPSTGAWKVGDIMWNTAPASGGTPGWVCTTAGSPGTWKAMANLA